MASATVPSTPRRPLPGAYFQTPQASNLRPGQVTQPTFQTNLPAINQQHKATNEDQALAQPSQVENSFAAKQGPAYLEPIQRASRTVNDMLAREAQYPELDSYVGRELRITVQGMHE